MKDKKLKIVINRSCEEVFNYTLDPKNTPEWIDGIKYEETNETSAKLGTIYRNQGNNGNWNEYKIVDFKVNETFTLSRIDGDYTVKYTFVPISENECEFEYHEWVENGELDDTVSQDVLIKLKNSIENNN